MRGEGAVAAVDFAFRRFGELEAAARTNEDTRRFWRAQIEDAVFLRLPRETGLSVERTVHTELVPIAAEVSEGLKRLAAEAGVPVKTVLLAAHLRVLSVLGGQRDRAQHRPRPRCRRCRHRAHGCSSRSARRSYKARKLRHASGGSA